MKVSLQQDNFWFYYRIWDKQLPSLRQQTLV